MKTCTFTDHALWISYANWSEFMADNIKTYFKEGID